ncbi:aldehyde dehydrogenase family protein [Solwaraspora sp. WMMD1047]|uniref:aldehyde dehydrogenase family protein n=1 Tax=Solwaraspora sp. WMMD1047 TaxID=3016102 RepID=UPI002415BE3E|nr:aldehyde dehydrogenase family protein [Solwaraspora sp. WMMD1047]MDG4830824.1 aldehyde dehydrogenase family protein [Solwaraspora sp. WMMD1047]
MSSPAPAAAEALTDPQLAGRIDRLLAVRRLIDAERDTVRAILTEISTYTAASYEIDAALATLDGAAAEVATHRPVTLRESAVFMPSNVLLYSYVLYLLVPSLFVRRVTFRPAGQVRAQTVALHRLLSQVHDLPIELAEVSQRAFLRDAVAPAELVVFTGRYSNGAEIRALLDREQLFLFFGQGVNPVIVTDVADLDRALADIIEIRLLNSGQDCLGPDAIFVHEAVLDRFVDRLVDRLGRLRCGPYTMPTADYGPICYDSALEGAALFLHRHRNWIRHGGRVDFRTRIVEPTVLVSRLGEEPALTEFFTPIFNVIGYHDEGALRTTLTSNGYADRALGASVYGDRDGALSTLLRRRHTVTVDAPLTSVDDGNQPFGGWGHMANHLSHRGERQAGPILISKAVAQRCGTI